MGLRARRALWPWLLLAPGLVWLLVFFGIPALNQFYVSLQEGSIERGQDQTVTFAVMDATASMQVRYRGLLPDLFREGQGVVAEGVLEPSGDFRADTVLAKHDEKYMPREVSDTLKKQGYWRHDKGS